MKFTLNIRLFKFILWSLRIYGAITILYCLYIIAEYETGSYEVLKIVLPTLAPAVILGGLASFEGFFILVLESIIKSYENSNKK